MKKINVVKQLQDEYQSTFLQTDEDPEDLYLYDKLMHISIEFSQTNLLNDSLMQKVKHSGCKKEIQIR